MNEKIEKLSKREINALHKSILDRTSSKIQIRTIQVGRERYVNKFDEMLNEVKETQQSYSKFIIADYGVGKSFLIETMMDLAKQDKFLVAKVDLSPDRLLYHEKKALATYSAILSKLECRGSRNALEKMLQDVCKLAIENSMSNSRDDINRGIRIVTKEIREMQYGEVFSKIIYKYAVSYIEDNVTLQQNCIQWIKGEYDNKALIKKDLDIDLKIDSSNYRQMLQIINKLGQLCGYNGLVVFFDECVNIKDAHHSTRKKNYEAILNMYNETTQGELDNTLYFFSGDVEFLTNEQKGLYSYDALKQRLNNDDLDYVDLDSNIWRVKYLSIEEQKELVQTIIDIYEKKYERDYEISVDMISKYVESRNQGLNKENLITRDVISKLTQLMNKVNNGDAGFTDGIEETTSQNDEERVKIMGFDDAF